MKKRENEMKERMKEEEGEKRVERRKMRVNFGSFLLVIIMRFFSRFNFLGMLSFRIHSMKKTEKRKSNIIGLLFLYFYFPKNCWERKGMWKRREKLKRRKRERGEERPESQIKGEKSRFLVDFWFPTFSFLSSFSLLSSPFLDSLITRGSNFLPFFSSFRTVQSTLRLSFSSSLHF